MLKIKSLPSLALPARVRGGPWLRVAGVVAGSLALALSARVALPVPFSPVPLTLQTLVVLLLALWLGRAGVASVALYVTGGALGLPILAGGWGGWARLAGPTGGYLLGFCLAAYVAGWLAERGGRLRALLGLILGQALIYACGLLWLARFLPAHTLLAAGLLPYLPGDALKLAAALAVAIPTRK
jgi:biotin transport system substrate-specific component